MIQAVLFDIDGTLIDSNELHVEAWHGVFSEAGHDVARSAIRAQIGKGGDNLLPALLPKLPAEQHDALATAHGSRFKQDFLPDAKPFPSAAALLRRVHDSGRRVLLASSAGEEEVRHYTKLLDVDDIVAASTSIDDVGASKPAPDIFAAALEKAGVPADQAIAVGDTPYDVISAGKAGIGTIALLSGGFAEAELRQAGADRIYADVAALLASFEKSPLAH